MKTDTAISKASDRILNLIIVDESGSMSAIYEQAFAGMNTTIENIKREAASINSVRQFINLITFDSGRYNQHLRHCPAEKARPLTRSQYSPAGCTPLYDAVGRAVTRLERHTTDNDAVLVTIITDGEENSSTRFTADELKRLINRLTEKGWLFTFIGANQDVMYEAGKIGIRHSLNYEADAAGADAMWRKENEARKSFYERVRQSKLRGRDMSSIMHSETSEPGNFFNK